MAKKTKDQEAVEKKASTKKSLVKKLENILRESPLKKKSEEKEKRAKNEKKKDSVDEAPKKKTTKKTATSKKTATTTAKKVSKGSKTDKATLKPKFTVVKKTTAKKGTSKVAETIEKNEKKADQTENATRAKKEATKKVTKTVKETKTSSKAKSTVKSTKTSKTNSAKTTTRKKSGTKKSTSKKEDIKQAFQAEYYDLPYLYNKTVVKILAQTPKMLFIYWEISEEDRRAFQNKYGENFFEVTRPVLIIFNDTMQYSFEIEINDFANSWYLHINDANCDYHIELGRRPKSFQTYQPAEYGQIAYIPHFIYLTSSNEIAAPNNKMLFNYPNNIVKFRNVKTGEIIERSILSFSFITNNGIFTIQELYKYLFPNEDFNYENIVLGNTSSGALSSSGMFSSQFK